MEESLQAREGPRRARERDGVTLRPEMIRGYLLQLEERGRGEETIRIYGTKLQAFYNFLPQHKRMDPAALEAWRAALLESGYSPGTVNTYLSAVNGLLDYIGRRDLQVLRQAEPARGPAPRLSRSEYLRLLQTARNLGRERTYLLVKVFALTGLRIGELPGVTVESAASGKLAHGEEIPFPACLRQELLDYARRQGILSGPVFVTRSGRAMRRTQVTGEIRALCRAARVEESKGSPRCLRRLCQDTLEEIEESVRLLAEKSYEHLLETEQLSAGWEVPEAAAVL